MIAVATRGLARYRNIRSEHGRWAAAEWFIDRVGARVINLRVSEVVWLEPGKIKMVGAPPEGFDFRFLSPTEIAGFASALNELDEKHVARAAAGRDLCFAALHEGKLATYGWYALDCIEGEHCDGVALSYPADIAYMYKGFTPPAYRGQRLHGYAMRLALEQLAAERGIKGLISTVSWLNWASLKSCDRLGYERLGRMTSYGWQYCGGGCYPKAARDLGIKFGRQADLSARKTV